MKFKNYITEASIETPNYRMDVDLDMSSGARFYGQFTTFRFPVFDSGFFGALYDRFKDLGLTPELQKKVMANIDRDTLRKLEQDFIGKLEKKLESEVKDIMDTVSALIKGKLQEAALKVKTTMDASVETIIKKALKK